jgi:hypothetical protein
LWFSASSDAWHSWWQATEYVTLFLQAAVTLEALLLLSDRVRNFSWKWRAIAILALPGVAAAVVAAGHGGDHWFTQAIALNQVLGFGLGVVALLAFLIGLLMRVVCSPRSTFHAGIVSAIWLVSGMGYREYDTWWGVMLAEWAPVILFLVWSLTIGAVDDSIPAVNTAELVKQSDRVRRSRILAGLK